MVPAEQLAWLCRSGLSFTMNAPPGITGWLICTNNEKRPDAPVNAEPENQPA